jgi:hypothetical protein
MRKRVCLPIRSRLRTSTSSTTPAASLRWNAGKSTLLLPITLLERRRGQPRLRQRTVTREQTGARGAGERSTGNATEGEIRRLMSVRLVLDDFGKEARHAQVRGGSSHDAVVRTAARVSGHADGLTPQPARGSGCAGIVADL